MVARLASVPGESILFFVLFYVPFKRSVVRIGTGRDFFRDTCISAGGKAQLQMAKNKVMKGLNDNGPSIISDSSLYRMKAATKAISLSKKKGPNTEESLDESFREKGSSHTDTLRFF